MLEALDMVIGRRLSVFNHSCLVVRLGVCSEPTRSRDVGQYGSPGEGCCSHGGESRDGLPIELALGIMRYSGCMTAVWR